MRRRAVHPHVRGAHWHGTTTPSWSTGPSPRAWGSPLRPHRVRTVQRSIPTCVGLTRGFRASRAGRPVHPHVRGAHRRPWDESGSAYGPSPRAWGSRLRPLPARRGTRSIPTGVGLTRAAAARALRCTVHPHVRGAHTGRGFVGGRVLGPSPRAWGSLAEQNRYARARRSIPTCVGLTGD